MTIKGQLFLGTSGIVVPHSKQIYPAAFKDKSRLTYYSSFFNSVEINSTFRQIPRPSTFERWTTEVPADFIFTLKLWKAITHIKQLKIELDHLDTFVEAANAIGHKKGCLFIQFPGSITIEYFSIIQEILQRLHELYPANKWKKAVEFRSPSWYAVDTFDLLHQYKASMVLQDMLKSNNLDLEQPFPFYYFRYHGPLGDYRGSYSNEFLQGQANKIAPLVASGKDVFVYFNNTMGNAFENAIRLQNLLVR
jgi:uncharacterized protein YecE (DUF72 family)